jgi:hypothetical protein
MGAGLVWAMTLPGLVCLLVVVAALERLGLWFAGRSWVPWRRHSTRATVSASAFDELTALVHATKHLELEERRTELVLREDPGVSDPRWLRLDLGLPTSGGDAPTGR